MKPLPPGAQPLMEYPCAWTYSVLGESADAIRDAIAQVIGEREHQIEAGRTSSGGKYCSVHLRVIVQSDADRTGLLRGLQMHAAVRYVL